MNFRYLLLLLGLAIALPGRVALAQVTAPSQGGEVNIVRVTATTMELRFGTRGAGQGRTVAIAATNGGMPVPLAASDGHFYSANATYGQGDPVGQGYAVYNGAGNTVIVSGLQPSTYYYLTNAEYNTDGTAIAYNTRGTSMSTATRDASPAPLPVELTAFSGSVDGHNLATLHWTTASEHNANYFAIECSTDGTTFAEAGRVAAASTSSQALAYQWSDSQQLTKPTYYRLRQVDNTGEIHYSSVVALAPTSRPAQLMEVYPNPSAGQTMQLLLQGYAREPLTLRLADALGRTVLSQTLTPLEAQHVTPLRLPQGLAAGTYVLTLAGSGSPVQKRIIVSD